MEYDILIMSKEDVSGLKYKTD